MNRDLLQMQYLFVSDVNRDRSDECKTANKHSNEFDSIEDQTDADNLLWKRVRNLIPANLRFPIGDYKCYSCDRQMNLLVDWEEHIFKFLKGEGCYPYPSIKLKAIKRDVDWYLYKSDAYYHSAICVFKCNKKSPVVEHILLKHFKLSFKCAICPKVLRLNTIRDHLSTHDSTTQRFKCSHCNFECLTKQSIQKHVITHFPIKPFPCQFCDRTFCHKFGLKIHVNKEHSLTGKDKRFGCPKCSFRASNRHYLHVHIRRKHFVKDQEYKCHYCFYKTWIKKYLVTHIMKNHMERKIKRPYQCDICELTYCRKVDLVNHKKKHSNKLESYPCDSCDSVFRTLPLKFIHNNTVHLSRYEYQCNMCKCFTKDRNSFMRHVLNRHLVTYYCHYCPMTFQDKFRTAKHINFKHLPLSLKCNKCKYSTKSKELLQQHMNVRHNPNAIIYTCYHCGHCNKIKHKLAQHMKTKHSDLLKKKRKKH